MQVYEEYCKRHSIGVPFVKHEPMGFFFIRDLEAERNWTILSINWNAPNAHPGTYVVRTSFPAHDCGTFEVHNETKLILGSDEYENYFYEWSKKCKKETICHDNKQILLTAWEMFVYCNDNTFARYFTDYSSVIFHSLDYNLPLNTRYQNYLKLIRLIGKQLRFVSMFKNWELNLDKYTSNYSTWLIDLVKENGC